MLFAGGDYNVKMDGIYINECVVVGVDHDGGQGDSQTDTGFLCVFCVER